MKDSVILFLVFIILFIALVPTTAFAEDNNREYEKIGKDSPINVYGKYVASNDKPVYSINISWGSMTFSYLEGSKGTWNPTTHEYDNPIAEGWTCNEGDNIIKVVNHSNTGINISFDYSGFNIDNAIQGIFSNNNFTIKTAEGTPVDNAPSETVSLKLSGTIDSTIVDNRQIGTISITIS